jgi:hypothetical protein
LDDPNAAPPFDNSGLGAHGCPSRSFPHHAVMALRAREVVTDALPARACVLAHERRTRG